MLCSFSGNVPWEKKKKKLLLTISPLHVENEETGPQDGDVLSERASWYFNQMYIDVLVAYQPKYVCITFY